MRSAYRTYRLALESTPPDATHRVVVQDDALPCSDFPTKLLQRVEERPDHLIALYLGGFPKRTSALARKAFADGARWIDFHPYDWVGTVGLVWPVPLIQQFLDFCDSRRRPYQRGDDGPVGQFVIANRVPAVAALPSLLEHPDRVPSVYLGRHRAGHPRVALFFDEA